MLYLWMKWYLMLKFEHLQTTLCFVYWMYSMLLDWMWSVKRMECKYNWLWSVHELMLYLVHRMDVLLVVGTSLQVYPAAGLVNFAPSHVPVVVVDPNAPLEASERVEVLRCGAVEGLLELERRWTQD